MEPNIVSKLTMVSLFQVITRDSVRSLIVPQSDQGREPPPLILSRSEFERILNAAKVRKRQVWYLSWFDSPACKVAKCREILVGWEES